MNTCDVAIVGAGPAGASAALTCVRSGAKTVIIEKRQLPRHKACSGILIPRSRRIVEDYFGDLPLHVLATPHVVPAMRMHFSSDRTFDVPIDGTGIWRNRFDHWLCKRSEADLCERTSLVSFKEESGGVKLFLRKAGGERYSIRCSVMIAADGGASSIVRLLDPTIHQGLKSYFNIQEVYRCACSLEPGYFHYFAMPEISPYPSAYVKNELLVMEAAAREGEKIDPYMERFKRYLWPRIKVENAVRVRRVGCWVTMAASHGRFHFGTDRILVAGEASGLLNLFGEGISSALASGLLAGQAAVKGIQEDTHPGPLYRREVQAERNRTEAQYDYGKHLFRTSGVFDWRAGMRHMPWKERMLLSKDIITWFVRLQRATR